MDLCFKSQWERHRLRPASDNPLVKNKTYLLARERLEEEGKVVT